MRIGEKLRRFFEPCKAAPASVDQVQKHVTLLEAENERLSTQIYPGGETPTEVLDAIIWNNKAISDLHRN